jgi:large subunit ribosomal protein L9
MKVILLADVRGLGKKMEIKEVSEGHARNFLFPRNLAKPASTGALQDLASFQAIKAQKDAAERGHLEAIAEALNREYVDFHLKTDAQGSVFGSVNKDLIEKTLRAKGLLGKEKIDIKLQYPLREFGESRVKISLKKGIEAELKIRVLPQQ